MSQERGQQRYCMHHFTGGACVMCHYNPFKEPKMAEQTYGRLRHSRARGCPTCDGVDPKSCVRCLGKTRMCDWMNTDSGWTHAPLAAPSTTTSREGKDA